MWDTQWTVQQHAAVHYRRPLSWYAFSSCCRRSTALHQIKVTRRLDSHQNHHTSIQQLPPAGIIAKSSSPSSPSFLLPLHTRHYAQNLYYMQTFNSRPELEYPIKTLNRKTSTLHPVNFKLQSLLAERPLFTCLRRLSNVAERPDIRLLPMGLFPLFFNNRAPKSSNFVR